MGDSQCHNFDQIPSDCQLFLFDMGNVVVKNISMLEKIAKRFNLDRDEFFQDYHHYDFPLMEGQVSSEQYWQHIHHVFGVRVQGNPFYDAFEPVFNDEVVSLIRRLRERGKRVVCASNTFESHWEKLRQMGALALFDSVYASHLLHLSKPSKYFFQAILQTEQVQVQQAYFVDDYEINVKSARSMGLAGLLYASGESKSESEVLDAAFASYR